MIKEDENKNNSWENLGISNDFMFGKIMRNPELCKELLERILPEIKIDCIEYIEEEKTIKLDVDAKSVRLDIYLKDDKEMVYDVDYSDFRIIPINLFLRRYFRLFQQVYRNKFLVSSNQLFNDIL